MNNQRTDSTPSTTADQSPQAIIFDFDGVFADSLAAFDNVFAQIFQRSNVKYQGMQTLREVFDTGMWDGLQSKGVTLTKEAIFQVLLPELTKTDLFPDIPPVIKRINEKRPDIELVIISANTDEFVTRMLQKEQIESIFSTVIGGNAPGSKTEKIKKIVKTRGLDPNRVYYVGDTRGDMIDASLAQVHPIAAAWGFHQEERLRQEPATEQVLREPRDLFTIARID